MCKIKNSQVTDLLGRLRAVDKEGVKSLSDSELANDLASLYYIQKEFEKYEELLKASAVERKLPLTNVPDLELKVQVKPGNDTKVVNLLSVFEWFKSKKRTEDFLSCVSFVDKKAKEALDENDEAWKVINEATEIKLSEKMIASVSKMTKQELKEATLKK